MVGFVLWRERHAASEEETREQGEAEEGTSQQVDPAFFEAVDHSDSSEEEAGTSEIDNEELEEYSDSTDNGEAPLDLTAQDSSTEVAEFDEEKSEGELPEDHTLEESFEVDETSVTDQDESSDSELRRGRHGIAYHDDEVDPPARESTDTGIIDLSAIRPGAVLPSRRALRQAREKGEGRLVIGGQEFDTGLIPQVEKEEETSTVEGSEEKRSWGSIMGNWISPKQRGQKGQ